MCKILKYIFVSGFFLTMAVPLFCINWNDKTVSEFENRFLASRADFYNEDGTVNKNFFTDFEEWFGDNIGFRNQFIAANARMQYYLFDRLEENGLYMLGQNGALADTRDKMIIDYQHLNLRTESEISELADSYQIMNEWFESQGIQFYYMQCWDKKSIYPEYYPKYINQYGAESATDQFLNALENNTDISIVSFKDELLENKDKEVYGKWTDPLHWNPRGAYIGYRTLMTTINERNNNQFHILEEGDYDLGLIDRGMTPFGCIHKEELNEAFRLINPRAYLTNEKMTFVADPNGAHCCFYTNDQINNDTCILIIGDSYLSDFIIDDIAESFHETVMSNADYQDADTIMRLLSAYKPDIVVIENAERQNVYRLPAIVRTAESIMDYTPE